MKHTKKSWLGWITKPHVVFLVLASVFGILSAFMIPQLTVSDENMHFLRAYNMASGKLGNTTCNYPHDINVKAGSVYTGETDAKYTEKVDFSNTEEASCGSAAGYSPIMHLAQSIGILLGKVIYPSSALMVLLGRLVNLAFYIAAVYFIIKYVQIGKWAFVVIALLPSMIHISASLSGDVMNNVMVLAMIAFTFNLFTQKKKISKWQLLIFAGLVLILALTKITNTILLLPLLFLPIRLFEKNKIKSIPFNIRKWSLIAGAGVLAISTILTWQHIFGSPLVTTPTDNPLKDNPLGFVDILINTYISPFFGYNDLILRGVVGEFASFQYHLPTFMVIILFVLFLIVLLHKNKNEEKLVRPVEKALTISTVCTLLLLVITISYALYTAWAIQPFRLGPEAPYADGVQGRYFTALLTLLIPLFIWLRRYIYIDTKSSITLGVVVFSISALSLAFYIIETHLFLT